MNKFTEEEINEIIRLYTKEELGLLSIGNKFNVGKKVITRVLKNNDIELRSVGARYKGGKKVSNKKYREKDSNKEKQQKYMEDYQPKYYKENKEKIREYSKIYRENNVDEEKIRHKKYRDENKGKINEYRETYKSRRSILHKEKMITDSLYKSKHNIRSLIKHSFKNNGKKKYTKTQDILGCSYEEFKEHIESEFESWMNWTNHGNPKDGIYELNKTWDLDHIIPISSAETEEDIIKLNHYTNFQPLCSYINRFIKRDSIE